MGVTKRKAAAEPFWNEDRSRWELFVELPRDADGRRRRKKVIGRNKSEVRDKAGKVRAELLVKGTVTNDAVTIKALMADYLKAARPGLKPRSVEQYEGWAERYVVPMLGTKVASKLTPADVRKWHEAMRSNGYSTNTIRAAHRVLRQALTHAEREGIVSRNVARVQGGPRDGGDIRKVEPLTPEQVADLLEAVQGWRYEAFVWVLLGCGLRIGEALGLTWGTVDLAAGVLSVQAQVQELKGSGKVLVPFTKTASSRRVVAIPEVVVAKLRAHRAAMIEERMALGAGAPGDDDVVFPNEFHELGDRSNIARMLKDRGRDAGIDGVHPHRLRHTHVSLALEAGVPLEAISESVGHARINTTKDIYGKLQERARRRVADALGDALSG